ncbi:LysR family transcriptional regulator [Janthinobacterium agaricidamnosum]|uniref:Bacterial regulatory helix-turn-helix, lysR family protein n=1 Tax=Janthinobacterium agaricidamnosum NBRC 102515 = DSM 9628 TaxID=1349767 RepID=W0VDI2_9BURK|nr:LysR family transcriptional regulator [Janthinobacterium agaricidamnosum]CDG85961.1 bacterial regulatory helix-turn-helix, lysR family protein [Janthinobacterium agaricidamnosum NBRC 102515 = DSM 9628]
MDTLATLHLLIDITDTGSFSAAARLRGKATSTVTLALQQLENEVGVRLVTRSTRRLALTHEGDLLLAGARRMLDAWEATLGEIAQDGVLQGPIRIAASNDFGRNSLLPLIDRFMLLHPGVKIGLVLSDSLENLLEQQLDIAVRSGPLQDSNLKARLLVRGRHLVCAAPSYWREHGKPRHPSELASHNCLVLTRHSAPLSAWPFVVDGKRTPVKVGGDRNASDGAVLRQWAIGGKGVMLKNEWDIRAELADGRLETALEDFVSSHIDLYAVYPKENPSRRAMAFIDYLSDNLRACNPGCSGSA